jgi:TolA-binding protein
MRSRSFAAVLIMAALLLVFGGSVAQQGPARGPIEPPRDAEKEVFAKHNLEVARYYITRRKAYQGGLDRLKEIIDAYPEFSRMDEVVYWMGEGNLKLGNRETAADFFEKLQKEYPGSEFIKKAKTRLDELRGMEKAK